MMALRMDVSMAAVVIIARTIIGVAGEDGQAQT